MKSFIRQLGTLALSALISVSAVAAPYGKNLPGQSIRLTEKLTERTTASTPVLKSKKQRSADRQQIKTSATGSTKVRKAKPAQAAKAAGDMPKIYGAIEYSGSRDNIDHTLCIIPTNSSEKFEVVVEDVNAIDGGAAIGDTYYAAYHTETFGEYTLILKSYDVKTGKLLGQRYGDVTAEATDVAYNPADGKVYGCFCEPDLENYFFGTIDYATATTTRIASLPRQLAAIAIDASGKIYGIDKKQEKQGYWLETVGADLYEIDAATGAMTFIGDTGQKPLYRSSACIDPQTGRMFWVVNPEDEYGYLYEVDTKTGATTLIYTFPDDEEIVGMYIPVSNVTAGSPKEVTDLAADFPNGLRIGTVSFTLPASDIDGNSLSGSLSYTVSIDGVKVAEGAGACGSKVNEQVTVSTDGVHAITVVVSNAQGSSPEASIRVYVGIDTPVAPEVKAVRDGENITLSWQPVTTAVNGGYIEPEKVTYRIIRYPDTKVLDASYSGTSYTDKITIPDGLGYYYYTVEAKYADVFSKPGTSDKIMLGEIVPPYLDDFNNIATFDFYTVIDANNDGTTWGPYIGNLRVSYNEDLAMDDWLISPPVRLDAGKAYRFSMDVLTGNSSANEMFEVKFGTAPAVDAMRETVIPRTQAAHTSYINYDGFIVPEESGIYYIGVHGCSAADMYTITIDNFKIEAGVSGGVPEAPENLSIVSRTNGELKADITFNAPSFDLNGSRLRSLDRVTIKRNGAPVKTFESPSVGARLTFIDEVEECGTYTYSVVAANADGESTPAEQTLYVGVLAPANPTEVAMVENGDTGEVTISWKAPATDEKGNALLPEYISYCIYAPGTTTNGTTNYEMIYDNITTTSFTFKALENPSKQGFVQYLVVAETLGGISDGMPTVMMPVGQPYATPFRESFANGAPASILATNSSGGARWALFNDDSGIPSCDGDNGFIGSIAGHLDDYGTLMTGKIDLAGLSKPALSFYTYSIVDDEDVDDNELEIAVICDNESTILQTLRISDYTKEDGWVKIVVPLEDYAGKTIRLNITSYCRIFQYTLIDCLRIDNLFDCNMTLSRISAPATVKTGTDFTIPVQVENNGAKDVEAYTVELYCNGEKVASVDRPALASFATDNITFTQNLSVLTAAPVVYKATVVCTGDMFLSDNTSDEMVVTPSNPTLPYVENLDAKVDGDAIVLTWDEPDFAKYIPDATTDDFESYTSWANSGVGDWIFVDLDQCGIGGFSDGNDIPGIPTGSKQSFWVMDRAHPQFVNYVDFLANSGDKYLAQMYGYINGEPVVCDDWVISPELYGGEQTVSFFARSYVFDYSESFEVLYSTGSTDPADFTKLVRVDFVPEEWTCYNVVLPDGARRFAIRCVSDFKFMFFIDDITFIPAAREGEVELKSFNVYRDGVAIANVPAGTHTYADTEMSMDVEHKYVVTAVHDKGESKPSAEVTALLSGIDAAFATTPVITGGKGNIKVCGAKGLEVSVIAPDGCTLYHTANADAEINVNVAAGLYIVTAGRTSVKVIVK